MKKEQLSYSALSSFAKSPNHLLSYWNDKSESTEAQLFGKLFHKLILEPDYFSDEFAVFEKRRAGAEWIAFQELHQDKTIITKKTYQQAVDLFDKTKDNPLLKDLLMRTGAVEQEVFWDCEGIKYHGFVDMVGDNFIADIKTTQDAGEKFVRDLLYNDYKMQAAMYLEAFEDKDFYIIAVEKKLPYNVQVYKFGVELLTKGYNKYRYFNKKYIEWDGCPVGYSDGIITLGRDIGKKETNNIEKF